MSVDDTFQQECMALGRAARAAGFRRDEKMPKAYRDAYRHCQVERRVKPALLEKKLLYLRISAVKRGLIVDPTVSTEVLRAIMGRVCPVSLVSFRNDGSRAGTASIDRLVNDGTYAPGNLVALSRRVNEIKGERGFEEVLEIASEGQDAEGLLSGEWARLASLMYAPWCSAKGLEDPLILPFSTLPPPHSLSTTSQLMQWILLRAATSPTWPDAIKVFRAVTNVGEFGYERFDGFATRLRQAAMNRKHLPSVWLDEEELFNTFVDWYIASRPAIYELLSHSHKQNLTGVDLGSMVRNWQLPSRSNSGSDSAIEIRVFSK